jgi:hypothetical protein
MTSERLPTPRLEAVLLLLALVGCHGTPPGSLVGESQHFRLYVDPDATVPAGFEGMNALAALETEWADVHTMLQMPEGKITYYWLSQEHAGAACGTLEGGAQACFWPQGLEVDAPTLPQPHELTHAYMYLRTQGFPLPLLAEGIAEAIECGGELSFPSGQVSWEEAVVADPPSPVPYGDGGAFVRHLIRTHGVASFLRYYAQAPAERDPAVFADNFQSFWGITMDAAWTSSHQVFERAKICPCSLPPLDATGAVANDPARAPYWTLPGTAGQTLALSGVPETVVMDCAGIQEQLLNEHVLVQLDGSESRYVVAPVTNATLGNYIADTCADAAPFSGTLADVQFGGVTIAIPPPPSGSATVYLNLASSFEGTLQQGLTQTCATCAFDQGSCQPLAPSAQPTLQGPLFARATLHTPVVVPPVDLVADDINIFVQ